MQVGLLKGRPDDANLFRSRCGGPIEQDLAPALPTVTLDRAQLTKGSSTVDLSGTRPFAAHGFAGTVRSTVRLKLGQPREESAVHGVALPRRPPAAAPRTVIATYAVEQVSGSIVTSFSGETEPSLCEPLDACGAAGSVRLSPAVSSGRATLVAYGPAARFSGRDLRAALGLRPGSLAHGISTSGVADWTRDAGTVSETFTGLGEAACTDTVPLGGGFVTFSVGSHRVSASYGRSSGAGPDLLRTHCPGPSILDAAGSRSLATGGVSRRAFGKRRVVITLSRGRQFEAKPYAGETRPALTIVLRRVRVRETLSFDVLAGL